MRVARVECKPSRDSEDRLHRFLPMVFRRTNIAGSPVQSNSGAWADREEGQP